MSVTTRHPQYRLFQDRWQSLRDAYQGDAMVRTAPLSTRQGRQATLARTRYLPRPSGMKNEAQYLAYVERPVFAGFT